MDKLSLGDRMFNASIQSVVNELKARLAIKFDSTQVMLTQIEYVDGQGFVLTHGDPAIERQMIAFLESGEGGMPPGVLPVNL